MFPSCEKVSLLLMAINHGYRSYYCKQIIFFSQKLVKFQLYLGTGGGGTVPVVPVMNTLLTATSNGEVKDGFSFQLLCVQLCIIIAQYLDDYNSRIWCVLQEWLIAVKIDDVYIGVHREQENRQNLVAFGRSNCRMQ